MHCQPLFAIPERHALYQLIRDYPLATLVTSSANGMEANLLPLAVDETGGEARLLGHVARSHSLANVPDSSEVVAVFQGPNAYISPRWYVNGQRSGRLAPSWNYIAAEVHGRIRFVDDPRWIVEHLAALTASQESGRRNPWTVADAAADFLDGASKHLLGFEIAIVRISGKRFLSQQRTEADRRSVIHNLALEPSGSARDLAALILP